MTKDEMEKEFQEWKKQEEDKEHEECRAREAALHKKDELKTLMLGILVFLFLLAVIED